VILAGDVGGTKTLVTLCDDRGAVQRESLYHCAEFASLEAVVDKFLGGERPALSAACFGVAGPVVAGVARITNLPWTIAADALGKRLGAPVALLNDLQATALGMLVLPDASFAVLQSGPLAPHSTIAVIAPGTGLGESLLVSDGTRYTALPSEAGHADFAPTTDDEIDLLRFLRGLYGRHVSVERVLSGDGIGDLYAFCRARDGQTEPLWLADQIAKGDRNAVIAEAGLAGKDTACIRALAMFVELLAAEASSQALRGLAIGGVVLGGGIPPKILAALQTPEFLARFHDKGRFADWTRGLAVRVSLEPKAALYGAIHHAVRQ
jgi:glucokinase